MKIKILFILLFFLTMIACEKNELYEYPIGENKAALITGFTLTETGLSVIDGTVVIDTVTNTIEAKVQAAVNLKRLVPRAEISEGAIVEPRMGEYTDFSSPVTYTLTSADKSTRRKWTITVSQ